MLKKGLYRVAFILEMVPYKKACKMKSIKGRDAESVSNCR